MTPALIFDDVTKSFPHHTGQRLLRDRIAEFLHPSPPPRLEVLKHVTFEVMPGEGLGVIGPNGAGKSTLLNLAGGLSRPDSGKITVNGQVAALLELGSGFHPDLTGAENIRINAAMVGLTRRQTAERFDEIVEFSGVQDFIDEPLRTYSSGMMMRLAFSVAVHLDPDILLMDEIIGVGDQDFFAKCMERMQQFQKRGKAFLLTSHSDYLLTLLCQQAIWLERGRVVTYGPVKRVLDEYHSYRTSAVSA